MSAVSHRRDLLSDHVVLVDETGRDAGTAPRRSVHTQDTPLHRAFSVYLFDDEGRTLLTRRALAKVAWPGVWSNSCCGHPAPGESDEQAIHRRVREELGVGATSVQVALPAFRYRAVDVSGVVENEVCPVYVARIDPADLAPDPAEVMEHSWVPWADAAAAVTAAPRTFSPWMVLQVPELAAHLARAGVPGTPCARHVPDRQETLSRVDDLLTRESHWMSEQWTAAGVAMDAAPITEELPQWLDGLLRGTGKRIRPSMCHWGYVAAGGTAGTTAYDQLVRVAAALEVLHLFALIHDDVMDESEVRRGAPSAHALARQRHREAGAHGESARFGDNIAVLLGDLAHMQADRLVAPLPQTFRDAWYELCAELIAGQHADLVGAAVDHRTFEQAQRIAQLKSGAYTIERPLLLGAMAAGADQPVCRALTSYGRHLGRAFALRDDILGAWGDVFATGKPNGDDLRNGKPTVLWVMAQQLLTGEPAGALHRVGTPGARPGDVELLQEAMVDAGLRDRAESQVRGQVEAALAALDGVSLDAAGRAGLVSSAAAIAWRDV